MNEHTEITTPVGNHKVVLKAWLTGREQRKLTSVFLKDINIKAGGAPGQLPSMEGLKGSIIEEAENLYLETVVVSINGSKEKIVDTILDMHKKDYQFIVSEVNKVAKDEDFEEKKTK